MNNWRICLRGAAVLAAFLGAAILQGCESMSQAEQGQVIGGVVGGVVGSQIGSGSGRDVAMIVGAIAGSMIGHAIGEDMDENDRMRTAMALNDSRTGEGTTWVNPDNGNRYTVTPTRTYEQAGGPCREFRLDARVGDHTDEDVYGTACLQADGSWLLQ